MKVAVIDIGTLKVKFLIGNVSSSKKFENVYQSNTLTGLGIKMAENNNCPHEERLRQTIDELKKCQTRIEKEKVEKLRVVSTHALREMGDVGRKVAERIKKEMGLKVEIISQNEEAQLFFQAVMKDFTTDQDFTVVDVGGGSVQILIGNKNKLKQSLLLKTGTSTLWDKFTPGHTGTDFPNQSEIAGMRNYILAQIQPIPKGIKTPIIYGSSCIIDLFKGINLPMQKYAFSGRHPYKAEVFDMAKFLKHVWSLSYDAREEKYVSPTYLYMWGVDKAFLNIVELAKKVEAPYVIPSNANINEGLILSL